ncbi:MAG: flagellar hook-length control protein FliK [Thermoguttaceae bacterium]|jgi:flagellar hook-length control protein FliK
MSVLNTDFLSRLTAIDPTYADYAASQTANSQTAFGNYLQMAQTQPANAAPSSGNWNDLESSNTTGSQATAAYAAPPANTSANSNPSLSRSADLASRKTDDDSSSEQPNAASTASSQSNTSQPTSTSQDAPTTSQDHRNDGSQDSGSGSSIRDSQPSGAAQEGDAHKVKKDDATPVTADINMVATAAANTAAIAGGNPANNAQAKTAPAPAGSKPGNAPNPSATVNAPQAISATAANGQAAAAEPAAAEMTSAEPALPAPKGKPGPATATSANPDDTTAGIDPIAAAVVTPANPAAGAAAPPLADPKSPQPATVSGTGAAHASQAADVAPAPANDEATAIPDVQSAQDQRTKSAVESLSPSGNDTNTTTSKPVSAPSDSTAAVPQTAAHNMNVAGGDSSTAQTADTNLSQSDRVRFVQRVEQAFQDLSDQGGSVRLRLSPPELGSLHIEINVSNGEMTARVQAETPAARNVLLDNLPVLRERLAQHDIKVQRFDVDLMDHSTGGMSNQSSQYQNPFQQNPSGMVVRTPFRGSSELPGAVEVATSRPVNEGDRLNVVV